MKWLNPAQCKSSALKWNKWLLIKLSATSWVIVLSFLCFCVEWCKVALSQTCAWHGWHLLQFQYFYTIILCPEGRCLRNSESSKLCTYSVLCSNIAYTADLVLMSVKYIQNGIPLQVNIYCHRLVSLKNDNCCIRHCSNTDITLKGEATLGIWGIENYIEPHKKHQHHLKAPYI